MRFLSDEWLVALDAAARARRSPHGDPLAEVTMTIEQVVTDGLSWRLVIDHGELRVEQVRAGGGGSGADDGVVRLISDRTTATDIAAGRRAALDAFITGDLVIGGDVRPMIEHGAALETLGELFADLRADTVFD